MATKAPPAMSETPVMTETTESSVLSRAFERFFEMPVAFVLGVMWLAGASLMSSCALVLYLAVSALIYGR